MTARLSFLGIGLATAVLAVGFALGGWGILALPVIAVGLFWSFGRWRGWGWTASLGLISFAAAAAGGLWLGMAAGWMLGGAVAALSAWDLDRFARALRSVQRVEDAPGMERRHLLQLLFVVSLGLLLAVIALVVRLEFGLGWALLLGVLVLIGLSQVIGYFRRERV